MRRNLLHGFSLVELLLVLVLLSLIGTLALPAFSALVERHRQMALTNQLQAHLGFARFSGVTLHREVEVCGSSNGVDCDHAWENGWIVRLPASGELLREHRLTPGDRLSWNGSRQTILFRSNGSAPWGNGRFYVCDRDAQVVWQLVVNRQGRVRRVDGLEGAQDGDGLCPAS